MPAGTSMLKILHTREVYIKGIQEWGIYGLMGGAVMAHDHGFRSH